MHSNVKILTHLVSCNNDPLKPITLHTLLAWQDSIAFNQGVQRRMDFRTFKINVFHFVIAICDLVHDVEAIFHLPLLLTASGKLF